MPSVGRIIAYALAGVPAAIGVAFVARYAYATSDTHDAGLAAAALYAMTATGAFAGPACALAVGNNGRKAAAFILSLLAVLAIAANWTNTLGAIAQRGAGTEASVEKAKADAADARAEAKRLEGELAKLGTFTPTDAEAVAAARKAAATAERARLAECGDGSDPKQRGKNCRTKEDDEKAANEKLTAVTTNKAFTDRAGALESSLAAERGKLGKAPTTPSTNALGETLGRWLSLPASAAVSVQQGFLSLIVELLIAAALALPELLRRAPAPVVQRVEEIEPEVITPAPTTSAVAIVKPGNVPEILAIALQPAKGRRLEFADAFKAYAAECRARAVTVLPPEQFVGPLQRFCQEVGIRTRRRGEKVWLVDVQPTR